MERRPSPALVIACIALFAALAGTSIALPGKNSVDKNDLRKKVVGAKNIKTNAVTSGKIKRNAVTAAKIKDQGVGNPELKNNAVNGPKLADNSVSARKIGTSVVRTGVSPLTADADGHRTARRARSTPRSPRPRALPARSCCTAARVGPRATTTTTRTCTSTSRTRPPPTAGARRASSTSVHRARPGSRRTRSA